VLSRQHGDHPLCTVWPVALRRRGEASGCSCSHRRSACSTPERPSQPAAKHPSSHAADRGKWMHDESGSGEGNLGVVGSSVDDLARAWKVAPPGGRSRCSRDAPGPRNRSPGMPARVFLPFIKRALVPTSPTSPACGVSEVSAPLELELGLGLGNGLVQVCDRKACRL
jgi:hypothetical protein